jgi:hypothetical protein
MISAHERVSRPTTMVDYEKWVDNYSDKQPSPTSTIVSDFDDNVHLIDINSPSSSSSSPSSSSKLLSMLFDTLLTRLRTSDGVDLEELSLCYGELIVQEIIKLSEVPLAEGLMHLSSSSTTTTTPTTTTVVTDLYQRREIRLTDPNGFLMSNTIISNLFAGLDASMITQQPG